jgi:2-furoate---CoA ligase
LLPVGEHKEAASSDTMLDLGTSFVASVARDPNALAIVDGDLRLTYREWYGRISALVAGFDALGLKRGDHLATALQNNWQAATTHWACQLAGIIITPLNWRSTAEELDYCLRDAEAKALVYEAAPAEAVRASAEAGKVTRIAVGLTQDQAFEDLVAAHAPDAQPRADAEAWSVMLYTSGTTARPKGVPRRQRAERAAALAHVAQNLYRTGERTLGVMPLYHTMGVRSLLAMSLVNGAFVCLPRFDVQRALSLIEAERISNLYLVPTLYHDLVHAERFSMTDVSSVRKLGFAGASMTDGLLKSLQAAFKPELFVNHYGSSEIYTFTIDQNAPRKPGSAGRAGINQMVRVIRLGASFPDDLAPSGEEGEIVALLAGDESFEGYWRRPDADAKALRHGWYFTGDTGYFDADGDLFVTGRVDDMIITGGENVSPVEIESCLSLHPAVSEVAVVGLPDERWGKVVTAFIKRTSSIEQEALDQFCRSSGLANFKRPRRYVFVEAIPKSPVGKLLRRMLVAGEYEAEQASVNQEEQS